MACAVVSKPVAKCALHLSIKVTQWCSQHTADARAQRGHSTFVGISAQNEGTKLGGGGGMLPQKILEFQSCKSG